MTENKNIIEYLGINVSATQVTNIKKYYVWDGRDFPVSSELASFLTPFDYGIREKGANFSISSFVKNGDNALIKKSIDLIRNHFGIKFYDHFEEELCAFQQFQRNIHYDPIISIKYHQNTVAGISYYVTALKDKSLVQEYMEQVISYTLNNNSELKSFIRKVVQERFADMFQLSWDFDNEGLKQNKVYLKVKNRESFIRMMEHEFPNLKNLSIQEGYRFCELAFVIKNGIIKSYNLYYKPLCMSYT